MRSRPRDARFNEYDHASLLACFEGHRLQGPRAAGDRRAYFTAIRDSLFAWSKHDGPIPDGERGSDFGARIQAGVGALCEGLGRDDNVLIVSSGGVIGHYTATSLGTGAEAAIQRNLQTRNTGVTEAARGVATSRIVTFNGVPHLERPDRAHAVTYS